MRLLKRTHLRSPKQIHWSWLRLIGSNLMRQTGLSLQTLIDSNLLKPIRLSLQTLIDWHLLKQIDSSSLKQIR